MIRHIRCIPRYAPYEREYSANAAGSAEYLWAGVLPAVTDLTGVHMLCVPLLGFLLLPGDQPQIRSRVPGPGLSAGRVRSGCEGQEVASRQGRLSAVPPQVRRSGEETEGPGPIRCTRVCPTAVRVLLGRLARARSGRGTTGVARSSEHSPHCSGPLPRAAPQCPVKKSSGLETRGSRNTSQRLQFHAPGAVFMSLKSSALLPAVEGSLARICRRSRMRQGQDISNVGGL
ncbi:hypothetical protein NDU88_001835 [Pleurodeles waltl]|uniref:Uncharacterized protein n=1 Tax=Pleurodeles waltl TaxID=8319 RepID=A0AAV7TK75_PLEWA|nr:hypothetical protein NDU88_001835 [Pleurodeles waltl]